MKASALLSLRALLALFALCVLAAPLLSALSATPERKAQDVEDCVACRYVWLQVEMDVGNSQIEENIYDSFTQNCIEAQKVKQKGEAAAAEATRQQARRGEARRERFSVTMQSHACCNQMAGVNTRSLAPLSLAPLSLLSLCFRLRSSTRLVRICSMASTT